MKNLLALLLLASTPFMVQGQSEKKLLRDGNKEYQAGQFDKAEINYRKALIKENGTEKAEGNFNLGTSLFQLERYEDALKHMNDAATLSENPELKAKAHYNAGNSLLKAQKLEEAIEAYKQSLRLNPLDADAKHNLSLALQMKKQQDQQKDQNKDQDKDQDKKDDKDKKDQDKEDDQKDKDGDKDKKDQDGDKKDENKDGKDDKPKDGDQKDGDKKDGEQKQPQPKEGKLSKEEAQRLLQALQNREKEVQQQMLKKMKPGKKTKSEKDW